uniref:Uncharacterized protein n=1 Tax=Anopheles atroparvus TaxID=41427 RepID=A0A182JLF8_ANOAO
MDERGPLAAAAAAAAAAMYWLRELLTTFSLACIVARLRKLWPPLFIMPFRSCMLFRTSLGFLPVGRKRSPAEFYELRVDLRFQLLHADLMVVLHLDVSHVQRVRAEVVRQQLLVQIDRASPPPAFISIPPATPPPPLPPPPPPPLAPPAPLPPPPGLPDAAAAAAAAAAASGFSFMSAAELISSRNLFCLPYRLSTEPTVDSIFCWLRKSVSSLPLTAAAAAAAAADDDDEVRLCSILACAMKDRQVPKLSLQLKHIRIALWLLVEPLVGGAGPAPAAVTLASSADGDRVLRLLRLLLLLLLVLLVLLLVMLVPGPPVARPHVLGVGRTERATDRRRVALLAERDNSEGMMRPWKRSTSFWYSGRAVFTVLPVLLLAAAVVFAGDDFWPYVHCKILNGSFGCI